MNLDDFAYQPVDSAVPVPAQERHTEEVKFRISRRRKRRLEEVADEQETSVSEIVREALEVRWGIK